MRDNKKTREKVAHALRLQQESVCLIYKTTVEGLVRSPSHRSLMTEQWCGKLLFFPFNVHRLAVVCLELFIIQRDTLSFNWFELDASDEGKLGNPARRTKNFKSRFDDEIAINYRVQEKTLQK